MEKQKRWQFYLILAVILLTLYNILPTIFYYAQPLKVPVDASKAQQTAIEMVDRVNELEQDSKEWLASFSKNLGIYPTNIELKESDPGLIEVSFANEKDAELFKRILPRAGTMIPFVPAQLELFPQSSEDATKVLVTRQIDIHLNPSEVDKYFHFSPKYDEKGQITGFYRNLIFDRATQLALGFGGTSQAAIQLSILAENSTDPQYDELVLSVAKEILDVNSALGKNNPIAKRYFASFSQINLDQRNDLIQKFVARAQTLKINLGIQQEQLDKELKQQKETGELLNPEKEQKIALLISQQDRLDKAVDFVQKNMSLFKEGNLPLTENAIKELLQKTYVNDINTPQVVYLNGTNPFVESLIINWASDKISIQLYSDIDAIRRSEEKTEAFAFLKEKTQQLVINDIARVSRATDEKINQDNDGFSIALNTLSSSQSVLTFDLGYVASKRVQQLTNHLRSVWTAEHTDLNRASFPIMTFEEYNALPASEQKLALVVYAPAMYAQEPAIGFRPGSIYVIAKGMDTIIQKARQTPDAPESQTLMKEISNLQSILSQKNFISYPGSSFGIDPAYRKDYLFELDDYYSYLIKATREDFHVKGSKRNAALEFTDVEQRILTRNKIDDRIQEDLLKWKEEYSTAQVSLEAINKYLVPAPTKNAYWENFKLSFVKYFRGDDRKILKWGLDLSGGKTVRIGLKDRNNRPVTNPDDLRQAVNELYSRVNAMGVAERTIRIENNNIILDFPGSQALSAAELIKASAMYFHIVNEKFTPHNPQLRQSVNQFLQNVWNEAVVTNRKDIESINMIAWQHLGGDSAELASERPISQDAKELYKNGLRIANPKEHHASHSFDDTLSSVAMFRGEDVSEWDGQTNPLVIVFHNYALDGSSLTDVQVGYDPTQGNMLSFSVKRSYEQSSGSPREDFYTWTSQFAEDRISGTPREAYSQSRGWRMAVILNDQVISAPVLRGALREGGTISGHFSQREINQLAADLKAGSLSFTPHILSEQNVSPELGYEERMQGIGASLVALVAVVIAMIAYYHFAGIVASCAVIFNILIMWGVLQNIGAVLTLPGIAGIVLTIGMAVDANVLVFERVREEFKVSGRIASAIQAGYRKAFSAIIDSNLTTILAALILLQFDSGPIKGFAVTLIIGIVSSMFTALFMTRYFFAGWVQNPDHKSLSMGQFFEQTSFNFLAKAKPAILLSLVIMMIGTMFFVGERKTIFGMDFTGGYSINLEVVERPGQPPYRQEAAQALLAAGATSNDFQIRELSKPNQLRIQLGVTMEEKGHPFYQMPEALEEGKFSYPFQKDPRIAWLVNALQQGGLQISPAQLPHLDRDWNVVSGQLSDTMRNNAIIALALALVGVLIYITIRFEFKYAIAAVIALVHDLIITLGLLAFFHWMGFPVQIDLQVIGAFMTIIGYSLNDTIIVFDRIREDLHILRKMSYPDIINHALNVTLARTVMTSGTTLLVLIALVLLGGKSILAFSLVMTLGVLVGTFSSLFIATPALLYFHNREVQKEQDARALKHS